MIQVPTE